MKKIIIIAATLIAAFSISSCNKEQLPVSADTTQDVAAQDIKVVVNVGGINGADTRALKSGWTAGDKINIWFDGANCTKLPELVLTYNGSAWDASKVSAALKTTGACTFIAVYEESNKMFESPRSSAYAFYDSYNITGFKQEVYKSNLSCTDCGTYTFDGSTVKMDINQWKFINPVQVLVTGIDDPDRYLLRSYYMSPAKAMQFASATNVASTGQGTNHFVAGTRRDDGISFGFKDYSVSNSSVYFELLDKNTNVVYRFSLSKGTIPSGDKLRTIKIDFSRFNVQGASVDGVFYSVVGGVPQVYVANGALGLVDFPSIMKYTGEVNIPAKVTFGGKEYSVTGVGNRAFYGCDVTSITLPEGLKNIDANAFCNCTKLKSLYLPKTVTSINGINPIFMGSSQLVLTVDPENTTYFTEGGVLYRKSNADCVLMWLMECTTGDLVLRSNTVSSVTSAMRYVNVSSIEFPACMSSLWYAFATVPAGGMTLKFNYASYDDFNAKIWSKNPSNPTAQIQSRDKIDLQVPAATTDEDIERYKALGFRTVTRR